MASQSRSKIYFFFETPATLAQRTKLKKFIQNIFREEEKELISLNYIFCTDQRVLEINQQYLKHHFYTDIISFELSAAAATAEGEIYISVDRVRDNAITLGEPLYRELHRVIFHGALHLCGYKDKTPIQARAMRKKEDHYLAVYFG